MSSITDFENASSENRAQAVQVWKARKFIEEHSAEELSLQRVAKAVKTHPNYLSEKFKHVTGMNFVEYVACTRFKEARRLLHDGELRITDIAFATGFQSLSQFNRVFKRLARKSPTDYREEHLRRKKWRHRPPGDPLFSQKFDGKLKSADERITLESNSRNGARRKRAANL